MAASKEPKSSELTDVPVTDRFNLQNQNFLITGGGRGIGFACAKAIAQLGGGIAVIDILDAPIDEFHMLGQRYGVKTCYAKADVTNQESFDTGFAEVLDHMGQLHGGLMAAGVNIDQPLIEAKWGQCQRLLNINVMGTFWGAHLLAKHLVDTKTPGSIVLIASLSAQGIHLPVQAATIYNASKAAIKGMVGPLSVELGPYGIRVNSVSPGAVLTPMTAALETDNPAILNWFKAATPCGRVGIPEDITPMVCYLLSDAGSFSTGADHVVTGGIHAGRCDPLDVSKYR